MRKGLILATVTLLAFAQSSLGQHSGHEAPKVQPQKGSSLKQKTKAQDEPRIAVQISSAEQSKIGLKTAKAETSKLDVTIRTVGSVSADQTREAHVHTRLNGWIERIFVDAIGKPVKKGEPLFELYSPDLVATQEEYLAARRGGATGNEIAQAALDRLRGWNVPESEISRLRSSGKSKRTVAFNSPETGFVVNKSAIQGMYITPEMELYHIADLSRIWIIVTLYESDINSINVGDAADVKLPYDESRTFQSPISYIYPELDIETRTSKARIELENKNQALKPGMFVNIEIKKSLGESVTVPEDAVIDTGVRRLVFLKKRNTEFEPREVRIGPRAEGKVVVLSGLQAGADVVVSAHFLLDAESKVQAALQKGRTTPQGHGAHGDAK